METALSNPGMGAVKISSRAATISYWIVTGLFGLQMAFTAWAQLRLPQVAEMFTHLGFPAYFRVELSWAKLLGVALLLAPLGGATWLKEWAYAGFGITLASALVAHFAVGAAPAVWSWAAVSLVLWAISCFLWRRLPSRVPDRIAK